MTRPPRSSGSGGEMPAGAPRAGQQRQAPQRRDRGEIDWTEIAARIEGSARSAAGEDMNDPVTAARILEERARQLAARPVQAPTELPVELLAFTIGGRPFAVESRWVVAVVRGVRPTPLPGATPPVAAVVAWRGRVLTTLDLRDALAAPPAPVGERPRLLVLGESAPEVGILVDGVDTLRLLPPSELHPVPEGTPARAEYLRAVTPDATVVLDAAAILRHHAVDA